MLWMIGLAALAAPLQPNAPGDLRVVGSEFLLIDERGGRAEVKPGDRVVHRPETSCYAWIVAVEPQARILRVREAFKLPAPASHWGIDGARAKVEQDGSGAVSEFDDDLSDGMITRSWCVSSGDPIGPHQINVYAGDRLLGTFRFEVVAEAI
ncbi:MAG TPA: hypothetical protein VF727_06400 [Allosphingosinicella sp.]